MGGIQVAIFPKNTMFPDWGKDNKNRMSCGPQPKKVT